MKLTGEYIGKGLGMSDVAFLLHIPRCSFYRNGASSEEPLLRKGRHNSSFTLRKDGDEIISVENGIVVNEMEITWIHSLRTFFLSSFKEFNMLFHPHLFFYPFSSKILIHDC